MDDKTQVSQPKNKSYLRTILIVGIILILGVLIAYSLRNKIHQQHVETSMKPGANASQTPSSNQSAETTNSNPIPSSEAIPLANVWNMPLTRYTNPAINITFDYPRSYQSSLGQPNGALSTQIWIKSPAFVSPTPTSAQLSKYSVQVFMEVIKNPENKPLLTVIKEKFQGDKGLPALVKKLTPTNVPVANSYVFKGTLTVTPVKKVFFANKGFVYEVTLDGSRGVGQGYSPEQEQFFDKFISSIKVQ